MKKTKKPRLSVVVLCYKSEYLAKRFYTRLVKSLDKIEDSFEVILVANYSDKSDKTPQIVSKIVADDTRAVKVAKKKKGMMGWDLQSGLRKAKGEYIAYIDGDDQFKPELIVKVYKKMLKTGADFVKTRRIRRDDGLFRAFISFVFNLGFLLLFGDDGFYDVNSKPKIMKKSLLNKMNLKDTGWFIDAEIMIEAKRLDAKIEEVNVHFHQNKHRESFVGMSAIVEMAIKLFKYRLVLTKKSITHVAHNWWNWLRWTEVTATSTK
jgi:glycosyltransferase involved in cell wall biosynthesis